MAAQNCRGDEGILSPAEAADGEAEGSAGEVCLGPSSHGDGTAGAGASHDGEVWPTGEMGEEGLELEIRGERGCQVLGGVATRGASRGGSGGPTSCRILLRVSGEQSVGVEVSALARTG